MVNTVVRAHRAFKPAFYQTKYTAKILRKRYDKQIKQLTGQLDERVNKLVGEQDKIFNKLDSRIFRIKYDANNETTRIDAKIDTLAILSGMVGISLWAIVLTK